MKNKFKNNNGYAILVTIVVVSIVLIIATGLSRSIYKQLILSSGAKDSQIAFYQADTASECALYFERVKTKSIDLNTDETEENLFNISNKDEGNNGEIKSGDIFNCGGQDSVFSGSDDNGSYTLAPSIENDDSQEKCFRIQVTKARDESGNQSVKVSANGYNICDKTNIRTVERTIEVNY